MPIIADWDTNRVLIADRLVERHPELVRELEVLLREHGIPLQRISGAKDIWIRDYAPVQIGSGEFVQFRYEPDYLRGTHSHLITGPEAFTGLPFLKNIHRSRLILDGGNIVGAGGTAILTDKAFRENPDRSRDEMRNELRRTLGVGDLIVIPKEPYDVIGHADGMVRFLSPHCVIVNDYRSIDPAFGQRLESVLTRHLLHIERLPYCPEQNPRNGIASAVGNYVNFLRVAGLVVVPGYGLPEDQQVMEMLANLLPRERVVSLPCRDLAREGGILNCVTATIRQD